MKVPSELIPLKNGNAFWFLLFGWAASSGLPEEVLFRCYGFERCWVFIFFYLFFARIPAAATPPADEQRFFSCVVEEGKPVSAQQRTGEDVFILFLFIIILNLSLRQPFILWGTSSWIIVNNVSDSIGIFSINFSWRWSCLPWVPSLGFISIVLTQVIELESILVQQVHMWLFCFHSSF